MFATGFPTRKTASEKLTQGQRVSRVKVANDAARRGAIAPGRLQLGLLFRLGGSLRVSGLLGLLLDRILLFFVLFLRLW